jgi:GNAT superfamily N-acetyltransferase
VLRDATADDEGFLWEMLCHSSAEGGEPLALDDLRAIPGLARYLDGWGRGGDVGLVAVDADGERLGAAWYRTFTAGEPGYGFVDEATPEVAIACTAAARGRGIGHELIAGLLDRAHREGVARLSLSVSRANPQAVRVYEDEGFVAVSVEEDGLHQTMVAPTRPAPSPVEQVVVRPLAPGEVDLASLPPSAWGAVVARLGELLTIADLPSLLAEVDGEPAGLLTWRLDEATGEIEVVALEAWVRARGVGAALLRALRGEASALGASRLWLITNNDNLAAIRFYQRRGWDLVAVHRHAAHRSRAVKPTLPLVGEHGIPVRHEVELELLIGT